MSPPRNASSAWSAALRMLALVVASGLATSRCASGACDLNSDCNAGTYCGSDHQCRYDCFEDRDCADGSFCNRDRGRCQSLSGDAGVTADAGKKEDAGETPADTGARDAGVDAGSPATDVGFDVGFDVGSPTPDVGFDAGFPATDVGFPTPDVGTPPVDAVVLGRAAYLDPCTVNEDCMSGECLVTSAGARFCTQRCVATSQCADGFICDSPPAGRPSRCVLDDTGLACDARTAVPCARFCVGNPVSGGMAHCTHECTTADDCPAGYACQLADSTHRVCISAEQPCTRAIDCTTNVCIGMAGGFQGCTSRCTRDSDCPRRMTINVTGIGIVTLPPYRCLTVSGEQVCVPPLEVSGGDVAGSRELGANCGTPGGTPLCRSGVCDSETNTCVQGCTPAGGCPSGFACRPWVDDTDVYLVCRRSVTGSAVVNAPCSIGADCVTGLCQGSATGAPAFCSRFCNDRLCPTGMRCMPAGTSLDGTPIFLCQR